MALRLVICKEYNGHADIRFCMDSKDIRLGNGNYADVSALSRVKGNLFRDSENVMYTRHADWSLSRVDAASEAASFDAEDIYLSHIDKPYGKVFAQTVGRFQEGFLRDKVCKDLDAAFAKAVEAATRLLPAIIAKAQ